MRSAQSPPIHPGHADLTACWLDEPDENIIVANRLAVAYALENQIVGTVRLYDFVFADCFITWTATMDFNSEQLQAMYWLNHAAVHCDGRVRGIAFRRAPITAAKPLVDRDTVLMHIIPTQPRQLTDSKPCVDGDKNHRGIRLRNLCHQRIE